MTARTRYISIFTMLLILLGGAGRVWSQSVEVSVEKQYPLLLKSIAFDRSFSNKLEDNKTVVIGIVFQEKSRRSVKEKDAIVKEILDLENADLTKYPVTYRLIPIDEGFTEDVRILIQSSSIMYATSLRGADIDELGEITRANNVLSVTMVPEDCRSGLTMSFESAGNRAKLLIHLRAARAEGCNFSSQLLKIANTF